MTQKHSPEPWDLSGDLILGAREAHPNPKAEPTGKRIAKIIHSETGWREFIVDTHDSPTWKDGAEANAKRMVACVNACAGIPTWALEEKGTGCVWDALNACLHQISTDSDLDEKVTAPEKYKALEQMLREVLGQT